MHICEDIKEKKIKDLEASVYQDVNFTPKIYSKDEQAMKFY